MQFFTDHIWRTWRENNRFCSWVKFDVCLGLVHRSVVKLFQGIVIHRPVLFFNQQLISWTYCTIFQTAKLTRTKSFGTILHLSFAIVGTCSPGATSDLSPFFPDFFTLLQHWKFVTLLSTYLKINLPPFAPWRAFEASLLEQFETRQSLLRLSIVRSSY